MAHAAIHEPHAAGPERMALARRARRLSWISLAWVTAEGVVGLAAGIAAGSIALVGWGLGSATTKDPGPWEGELRNMWKPTPVENLWIHGGNLHQSRCYSQYLALQLKARMEGLATPVHKPAPSHHRR